MESLEADENEYKDVLMNNFGVDSEFENETDDEESCLRLHRDFMAIPKLKKKLPPPKKLLQDQKVNATSLVWNKLFQNSSNLKEKKPFELFTSIWTKDVVIYIADETNIFAKQIIKKYKNDGLFDTSKLVQWKPTNPDEIYAYLGILVAMSQCAKPKLKDYFDPTIKITLTPSFKNYITEDRFWLLYNLVHIVDNTWFNQALANPKSDILQLINFMHHYCLKNNEYIKVWHRRKFISLLNYCMEKIQNIYNESLRYTNAIGKDIYDKLLEIYKTEDFNKDDGDYLKMGVVYCGAEDFRDKVVSHLPKNIVKKKGQCVLCSKNSLYFCPSCDVYLCLKNCYRKFSHGEEMCDKGTSSNNSITMRCRRVRRKRYDDDNDYEPSNFVKKKKNKGKTKVVASKKKS